uniref:Uncharacterized protein n=1 Tax=Hucho hucho TaxID=62062 RepID=A0A4W5KC82_9TELE
MSLHAINSQYTAQVKQAEHVVSEMQKLEEQNKKLREEIALSKQENQQRLDAAISEKERLKQEVQKLIVERDEHGKSYSSQIQTMQEELHLQKQQQSSSMNEVMEKMVAEKERLQVEETRQRVDELQSTLQQAQAFKLQTETEVSGYQAELDELRSESSRLHSECQRLAGERKETMALVGKDVSDDPLLTQLQAERTQLQSHLQRCLYEIQQRDLHCQQLNTKLQQAMEEKGGVSAQLRAVSQALRDTQNRCYWLENQAPPNQHHKGLAKQGAGSVEVAPGAPQERSSAVVDMEALEASELRTSVDSSPSRTTQRDFSIQLDTEEEWEALILNPNEHLVTRKVKGGMLACRRWLRGRSLYCSKLLTSRARSRYLFLGYLLILHVAVLMCLTGAL